MTIYLTDDGMRIEAADPEELVTVLRRSSWKAYPTNADYMEEAARHVFQSTSHAIRWGSAEDFVADLLKYRMIAEEKILPPDLKEAS
jgi:hypothetical protein